MRASEAGVAQAGRAGEELTGFIFTTHPALSDPLGAKAPSPPPPCWAEGEPCLPWHPAMGESLHCARTARYF